MSDDGTGTDQEAGSAPVSAPESLAESSLGPPPRGLVWVDMSQDQARVLPGRPKVNVGEDEAVTADNRGIKFEDEAVEGSTVDEQRRNYVKKLVGVSGADVRDDIYVDYMTNAVVFAQENTLNDEQTSAFFAISKRTFEYSRGSSTYTSGNFQPRDDAYAYFKSLMLQHSLECPPDKFKVYNKLQMRSLTDFMAMTFFRHYLAYELAFTRDQELRRLPLNVVVETPLRPVPLSKGQEVERPKPPEPEVEAPEIEKAPEEEPVDAAEDSGTAVEGEDAEEEIVLPERLQRIVDARVMEETNRIDADLSDLSNTLAQKMSLRDEGKGGGMDDTIE